MFDWLRKLAAAAAITSVAALSACGGNDDETHDPGTVVQVAQTDARFSILAEAVVAADLATTLSAAGPYTVFAPTNEAFTALLAELGLTKDQLFANRPLLTAVLRYHVLNVRVARSAVPLGQAITPLEGGIFKVDSVSGNLVVTDGRNRSARIVVTDVPASNGVIHAIDKVLLPADKTVVQTAVATPGFSILVEAVTAANLAGTLSGTGPFTVFAPTDAAFAKLPKEAVARLLEPAQRGELEKLLQHHVTTSVYEVKWLKDGQKLGQADGTKVTITVKDGKTYVDGALIVASVRASNGIVHVVDGVLLRPTQK